MGEDRFIKSAVLWNTPTPFDPDSAVASPSTFNLCSRLYAVEIAQIDGLTFFFYKGEINGIHVHQRGQASALPTFHRLSSTVKEQAAWIYVPFAKGDTLVRFGVRHWFRGGRVIILGTRLAGDTVFGMPSHTIDDTRGIESTSPLTLVYGDSKDDMSETPFFGVIQKDASQVPMAPLSNAWWPKSVDFRTAEERRRIRLACYTRAPLAGVVLVTVFYAGDTNHCQGAIFTYGNGGERSVGQCRIGVDRSSTFAPSEGLCF